VWRSLQTTIKKKLEYPLTALSLSEKDCKRIESPLRKYGLPECGVKRSLPYKVVDGPSSCHGLNNKRLFFTWGEKHVRAVLQFLESPSVTGQLMRACLEGLQLEAGTADNILSSDYSKGGAACYTDVVEHDVEIPLGAQGVHQIVDETPRESARAGYLHYG